IKAKTKGIPVHKDLRVARDQVLAVVTPLQKVPQFPRIILLSPHRKPDAQDRRSRLFSVVFSLHNRRRIIGCGGGVRNLAGATARRASIPAALHRYPQSLWKNCVNCPIPFGNRTRFRPKLQTLLTRYTI
ncbi:leucine-rich repeat-containing protein 7, partial [Striga asiatica]